MRERGRQTDTDRQTDREIDRETDRVMETEGDIEVRYRTKKINLK